MGEYMGSKCMDSDVEYVYLNNYYLEEKIFEANKTTYSNLQYPLIFIPLTWQLKNKENFIYYLTTKQAQDEFLLRHLLDIDTSGITRISDSTDAW